VVLSDDEQLALELPVGDSSIEDNPLQFRNLNEIYQDTMEVELVSDTEVQALLAIMEEPSCYREAVGNADWEAAMDSELKPITKSKTWELVKLPPGQKPICRGPILGYPKRRS